MVKAINRNEHITYIYAAYNNDENVREKSSSGGIFSLLAEQVLRNHGSVWGAAYDENMHVSHIEITSKDSLFRILGSKYVWSTVSKDIFQKIKCQLQNNKKVLFCGTPCQTASLVKFLGPKLITNLIAVDFTCHGTPLPIVWNSYLVDLQRIDSVKKINMRDKKYGWKTYSFKTTYHSGKVISQIFTCNHYLQAFLLNYSLRKSCYNCIYRGVHPISDITLADYWDINKKVPNLNDDRGISKVYVHTAKGKKMFHDIMGLMKYQLIEEVTDFITPQVTISKPKDRELFLDILSKEGFTTGYNKIINKGFWGSLKQYIKGFLKIMLHFLKY